MSITDEHNVLIRFNKLSNLVCFCVLRLFPSTLLKLTYNFNNSGGKRK